MKKGFREARPAAGKRETASTARDDGLLDNDGAVSNKIRTCAKNGTLPSGENSSSKLYTERFHYKRTHRNLERTLPPFVNGGES